MTAILEFSAMMDKEMLKDEVGGTRDFQQHNAIWYQPAKASVIDYGSYSEQVHCAAEA